MSAVLKESPLVIEMLDETTDHAAPALRTERAVAQLDAPAAGPMSSALAFLRAGGTVAEMRDVLALQREWEAGEAKKAYVSAMAEFKKNPPTIFKDKQVAFESKAGGAKTDYWHATLGNVAEAIIEGLAKVGISHSWKPERIADRIHVSCTLTHQAGHSESISLDGPLDNSGNKNSIQQMSSTTTYLSRYTLLMITGLAVKDEVMPDDDGRGAGTDDRGAPFDVEDKRDPLRERSDTSRPVGLPPYDEAKFKANLPAWTDVIRTGRKTADALIRHVEKTSPFTAEQQQSLRSIATA